MNVIARPEFELSFHEITVQLVNIYVAINSFERYRGMPMWGS